MKNLLVATIIGSGKEGEDIPGYKLSCRRDGDLFRWYDEEGQDTEVSAKTQAEAQQAAIASWGSKEWQLSASWLR